MTEIVGLGYVGVETGDLAAWETFATSLLGLELSERLADGTCLFRLDDYAYRIAVGPGAREDIAFVGWEVATEDGLRSPNACERTASRSSTATRRLRTRAR